MSDWVPLAKTPFAVPAHPRGIWTEIQDFVAPNSVLKITVPDPLLPEKAVWKYADAAECGADGDPASLIARSKCIFDKAPVGALIGKLGGSTAGAADGTVFVVGSSCVVRVGAEGVPLYLTINDEESGMSNNTGLLKVQVEQRLM